jgi:hypothetical protein
MLTMTRDETRNIAEITVDGSITKDEIEPVIARLDAMIDEFGKIRVVEVIKGVGKVEPGALWADLKWEPRHINSFSHVAVVADQKWVEWMVKPLDMLIPAKMRVFHLDELDEARAWIESFDSDR